MLLHLCLLLAGRLCHGLADVKTVLQNTDAALPCPHKTGNGDVWWKRLRNGDKVSLVSVQNGQKKRHEEHFDSREDKALLIYNVQSSDSGMYFCNEERIYLHVTTDPNMAAPEVSITHRINGGGSGLGPDRGGAAAAADADAENQQQPSDLWKIPVGVVIGVTLVLLVLLSRSLCSERRADRRTADRAVTEVIYEEIEDASLRPGREAGVERPYYWSSITETPNTPTSADTALYSTVNKLRAEGRCREEGVYSLAQNPQTGSASS
ncbi:uncharacterized protein [Trachinotus anak]|uniref:uncharacterized protein n=1 Tax=Trachinotus anak TaxID=443729 RepID=UPI0039F1CA35